MLITPQLLFLQTIANLFSVKLDAVEKLGDIIKFPLELIYPYRLPFCVFVKAGYKSTQDSLKSLINTLLFIT